MSLKVYLASRFGRQAELREVANKLRAARIEITSRWLDDPSDLPEGGPVSSSGDPVALARRDLDDIDECDVLVLFTEDPATIVPGAQRGGRHFECGYAHRAGKGVVIIGPVENMFHYLMTAVYESADEWLSMLLG